MRGYCATDSTVRARFTSLALFVQKQGLEYVLCHVFSLIHVESSRITLKKKLYNPQVCSYNHCVGPPVRPSTVSENAYNSNRMEYFDKILHTCTCQHCLTTGMHNSPF